MPFEGPLFIVGLSRSGTTLLRSLLNRNSRISLTIEESHFVPFVMRKYGKTADFSSERVKKHLRSDLEKTIIFHRMKLRGCPMDWDELNKRMDLNSWNEIIRFIFQSFAIKPFQPGMIWGDKTPRYLPFVPEIKEILPAARFIHIVRDPRDRAMSVHARWNKLFSRSAMEWNRQIRMSRSYPELLGKDYMEIRYEELLSAPEKTMRGLCKFLEIDFEPPMLTLEKADWKYGDTKGKLHIVPENHNKFAGQLSERKIRRIEEIAYPMMRELGYPITVAVRYVPVGRVTAVLIRILDMFFHGWSIIRSRGILGGIDWSLRILRNRILLRKNPKTALKNRRS
ncbi:MAG: sulfotransferase [Acidobacteria bacterium]|nr:sulfotransferase [Acidobacteriota bacterium]